MGWGRGAQVGSPSAPKALESQRHQSSMTSPLPEHHSELMVASCKSWEGGEGSEHRVDIPPPEPVLIRSPWVKPNGSAWPIHPGDEVLAMGKGRQCHPDATPSSSPAGSGCW